MTSARKRPRLDEETQAECPYTIAHPDPKEKKKKLKRRRQESEEPRVLKLSLQASPFSPNGKFKDPDNTMDRYYQVLPHQSWLEMTRYSCFVLNGVKYRNEGFVFVANSSTIERQKNSGEPTNPIHNSNDDWVARILEIRASDVFHVYARVYWMYWPDELPPGTQDGEKSTRGRQPYHGQNELIASNHMDIINVVSVTGPAKVNQWDETNEDEVQKALYWRQAFDVRSMELSSVLPRCQCNQPENPDRWLINCANPECRQWLHDDCLVHEILMKTYLQLGIDKPHKPARVKSEPEGGQSPLSSRESSASQTTQQSIDVKAESPRTIKLRDIEMGGSSSKTDNSAARPTPNSSAKRKGRPRKSEARQTGNSKPYEGLFSAVIHDASPPMAEIRDLRTNVKGGEKSWMEPLYCLVCSTELR